MKISVKAGGLLYEYLPAERQGNRADLEVADGTTAQDLLNELGMPGEGSYLFILNGELVPVDERASRNLHPDDQISINPPLKGG